MTATSTYGALIQRAGPLDSQNVGFVDGLLRDSKTAQYQAGLNAVGYSTVAALTFLCYDIIITFPDEVRLIWPNSWNLTKGLFFFIRYFPVILQITIMFLGTPPFTFTHHECYIWNVYQALATTLIISSVDYILVLRVFALYPRKPLVRYMLVMLYVLEVLILSVGMGLAVPGLRYDETCTVLSAPITYAIAVGAPIVFQALLFVLTGWKFVKAIKSGWGDIPIMKLLMRDGTWAFALLFVVLVSEAALYGFATDAYSGILYGWLNTTFSFCGYRILLNLHRLNIDSGHYQSSRLSTNAEIQFSTNFEFEPISRDEPRADLGVPRGPSILGSRENVEGTVINNRRTI